MKHFIILMILWGLMPQHTHAQSKKQIPDAIRSIMNRQEAAWNRGDLDAFMIGYWNSDQLTFIGSKGLTHGYQPTLANYKKGYPTIDAMGKLTFTLLQIEPLSRKSAFVVGKWQLDRKSDVLSGHFTLLWKKIRGEWVIVADHSS